MFSLTLFARFDRFAPIVGNIVSISIEWRINMIVVGGQTYYTIVDAAAKFGVSAKTVRSYIDKGVIPTPPTVKYGMRVIKHFPSEYIARARRMFEKRMKMGKGM
jgi:hypothetical protein